MSKIDEWNKMNDIAASAGYAPSTGTSFDPTSQQQANSAPKGKGLLGAIIDSFTKPIGKRVNQAALQVADVVNTAKMGVAAQTHNADAFRNANQDAQNNKQLYGDTGGLFNAGTINTADEAKTGDFKRAFLKQAGNTAQLESMLMPVGKGATIAGKVLPMAAQGALYGGGEALASGRNDQVTRDALTGGAVGGVVGGASGVLGKVLGKGGDVIDNGIAKRAGAREELASVNAFKPFETIPKGVREQNNLAAKIDFFRNHLGMDATPETFQKAAHVTTGDDGAISGIMRQLTMQHETPIQVNGFMGDVENAINRNSPILGEAKAAGRGAATKGNSLYKNFMDTLQNNIYEGEGSLSGRASAEKVFNTIQDIDKQIARYKGAAPGSEGQALADVYHAAKDSLEHRLYNDSGFNKTVSDFKLGPSETDIIRNNVDKMGGSSQLADHVINGINDASSGQALRSLQRPFVEASSLSQAAQKAAGGALPQMEGGAQGGARGAYYKALELGRLLHGDPTAALPLMASASQKAEQKATTPGLVERGLVGLKALTGGSKDTVAGKASNVLQATGETTAQNEIKRTRGILPTALTLGATNQRTAETPAANTQSNDQQFNPMLEGTVLDPRVQARQAAETGMQGGAGDASGASVAGISRDEIEKAMVQDLANGGKNFDKLKSLYAIVSDKEKPQGGVKPSSQQVGVAQSGTASLEQLKGMLQKNPDILNKTAVPGSGLPIVGGFLNNILGTGEYKAASNNTLDALARMRTGAAMTKSEERFYQGLLPQAGDSPQVVNYKLQQISQAFGPYASQQIGAGN